MLNVIKFLAIFSCWAPLAYGFPTTSVLDDFTRTVDETPIAGNWTPFDLDGSAPGDRPVLIASEDQVRDPTASAFSSAYWNAATFGTAQEAYFTMPILPAEDAEATGLVVRYSDVENFYCVEFHTSAGSNNDFVQVYQRTTAGGEVQIGTNIVWGGDFATNDVVGVLVINEVIEIFRNGGSIGSRTATGGLTGNRIGIRLYGSSNPSTFRVDNFGGGDYVPPSGRRVAPMFFQ